MPKHQGFSGGSVVKNPASDSEDIGSIPGLGRSTGGGNGYPLQDSCLENPMDRRAWWATIHRVSKSWTQLNELNNNHKGPREVKLLSCVQLFVTPWTVAYEAPPSMGFPRPEYWSG